MIKTPKFIEFKVSNYRSIKGEVIFSMVANESVLTSEGNTFEIELQSDKKIKLLKTAVIYGANASGKSNILKAYSTFLNILKESSGKNLGDKVEYDPFLLDKSVENSPTNYSFDFIGSNSTYYKYKFSHTSSAIIEESLDQFFNGEFVNIFKRNDDVVVLGDKLTKKNVANKIITPRLFLSHLANNLAEEILGDVYTNIQAIKMWSFVGSDARNTMLNDALKRMSDNGGNNKVNELVNRFIVNADFQTLGLKVTGNVEEVYSSHKYFDKNIDAGTKDLPFYATASEGTKFFIGLIGVLATIIEDGVPCLFDEINTSLHPDLCRLIIRLLNDPSLNLYNSQLIFTTHDISLLEKTYLRRDQVWFTEKNNFGSSELYSAQDFDDIPETISLGELYDTGFFRAKPKINETRIKFPNT